MTAGDFFLPATAEQLRPFVGAGLLDASSVYLVDAIDRRCGQLSPELQLAAALAARAPQYGHVCVPINDIQRSIVNENLTSEDLARLPWPDAEEWASCLRTSDAVWLPEGGSSGSRRPLVFDGTNLYLNRLWVYEQYVGATIRDRCGLPSCLLDDLPDPGGYLDALIARQPHSLTTSQLDAVRRALTKQFSVIAGGPGTGKTHTIAGLLTVLAQIDRTGNRPLRIGLCAPTGKAASRMSEAIALAFADIPASEARSSFVEQLHGSTIQRMLGSNFDGQSRFNAANLLPYDMVVVDEGSMVSLPLMHSLLRAVRGDAGLVIVGDPDQLTSIEAGAVLGDIVHAALDSTATGESGSSPLADAVTTLGSTHRFSSDSAIATCAELTRRGDAEALIALLHDPDDDSLRYIEHTDTAALARLIGDLAAQAKSVVEAATAGYAQSALGLLSACKVLCATRHGGFGSYHWSNTVELATAPSLPGTNMRQRWYSGKPLIAIRNDYANTIFNGDVGIISEHDGQQQVAMGDGDDVRWFALSQWAEAEPWWAMTIHRSQGSEFNEVVVVLPDVPMPLLTRELLYTAITRARRRITIVGNDAVIRSTIERRIGRSTGLASLLQR